jgi:hypothetical protein
MHKEPESLNGWRKKISFAFLILSTLPSHCLWNSAVFNTTQNLDYNVLVVTPGFLYQSTVGCSHNSSMYYQALTMKSSEYSATKYLKRPLRWKAGSLRYNKLFQRRRWQYIQSAFSKLNSRVSFPSMQRRLHPILWIGK